MLVCACFSRIRTKKWKCRIIECAWDKFSWCQTALQLNDTNLHTCQQYMKDQFSHQLANINNFLSCFPCIYILSPGLGVENPESRPMMTSYWYIFPYSEVFSNWCSTMLVEGSLTMSSLLISVQYTLFKKHLPRTHRTLRLLRMKNILKKVGRVFAHTSL